MNISAKRVKRVCVAGAALLCAGLFYARFINRTGLYVPCVFHLMTSLNCPGCGMTRMCLAVLRGDLHTAYLSNRGVFILLPLLAFSILMGVFRYITETKVTKYERTLDWLLLFLLCAWFIIRNIAKI